ncbi:MAG TPA: hypothetical protein VIJ49_01535 [Aestuariivirga sp.]
MMTNFKQSMYHIARPIALAALLLSVAPVLAGSFAAFQNPVKQYPSSGQSVVYSSGEVVVVNQS